MRFIDITNQKFNRLLAIRYIKEKSKWECLCDCGNTTLQNVTHLRNGHVKSCGCYNKEIAAIAGRNKFTTHGLRSIPEYKIWAGMKQRCLNPNNHAYKRYAGRGIEICNTWVDSFETFLSDMGTRPSAKHSLDRIDNSKGYNKDNCRWATDKTQANNKRNNRYFEYKGESHTIPEWARITGIKKSTLGMRLYKYGWTIEKALTHPVPPTV